MLTITVLGHEAFDESSQEFTTQGDVVLELEHSLLSLSKWESKYEKPFLEDTSRTEEEVLYYVKCMVLTPNVPEEVFLRLSEENYDAITAHMNAKMTATWFSDNQPSARNQEKITSELLYYWMAAFRIPFECERWHLNRLLTLIKICNLKQAKPKKMSRAEIAARNRQLNAKRRAELNSKG